MIMSHSAGKRRSSAEHKARNTINNSDSKALYSFAKAERFPTRMYRSVTDIRFYDVEMPKYNKRVSFTTSQRTNFCKDNGNPGPTKYNPNVNSDKKLSVQFKSSREVFCS